MLAPGIVRDPIAELLGVQAQPNRSGGCGECPAEPLPLPPSFCTRAGRGDKMPPEGEGKQKAEPTLYLKLAQKHFWGGGGTVSRRSLWTAVPSSGGQKGLIFRGTEGTPGSLGWGWRGRPPNRPPSRLRRQDPFSSLLAEMWAKTKAPSLRWAWVGGRQSSKRIS